MTTTEDDKRELSEDEVFAIREVYKSREFTKAQLADHFKVDVKVIHNIAVDEKLKTARRESAQASSVGGIDSDETDETDETTVDQSNPKIQWTEAWWATRTPETRARRCVAHRKNGEAWWATRTPETRARRCVAHRKNGDQCKRAAINGAKVCRTHGGATKHIRNAARARLQNAADRMARELLRMAEDDNVSDSVKLAAIKDALDRGGLGAKTEVEITAKPYEAILDNIIESGSRSEFRASRGIEDEPRGIEDDPQPAPAENHELPASDGFSIVDAEVLDDEADLDEHAQPEPWPPPENRSAFDSAAGTDDQGQPWEQANPFGPTGPPPGGIMPLEDAVAATAELRRSAVLRPIQRALPPGRSR